MTKQPINLIKAEEIDPLLEREVYDPTFVVGQWYWYQDKESGNQSEKEDQQRFVCITHIGSNHVQFKPPSYPDGGSYYETRLLFKDAAVQLTFEPNHDSVLASFVKKYQLEGNALMEEIKAITSRLGLKYGHQIEHKDQTGTGIAVISEENNITHYKTALIKAEKEDLPNLFKKMKAAHKEMARWMSAESLSLETMISTMDQALTEVKGRIFNVTMYAGLEEHVNKISDGESADILEKLHIMQRKLYMDEECLLNYSAGGMAFNDINDFDAWLSLPDNLNRILPFQRTLVAMQIRRKEKDYDNDLDEYIKIKLRNMDKYTFFYLRNGEQLYRLSFDHFEFDDMIFPDRKEYDPSEPKMMKIERRQVESFVNKSEYDQELTAFNQLDKEFELWKESEIEKQKKDNPNPKNNHYYHVSEINFPKYNELSSNLIFKHKESFHGSVFDEFNEDSVYYDEGIQKMLDEIDKYNRIVLIVQGLFDRSEVLAPHLPAKTWTADGFNQVIKLVYDNENALYAGIEPDINAYFHACNAKATNESLFVGQLNYWMHKEAEKENARLAKYDSYNHRRNLKIYKPEGNDGMPLVSKAFKISKDKNKVTFKWLKPRVIKRQYGYLEFSQSNEIECSITVPMHQLLNVSAYQLGDYKQFFVDPRTRQQYLKWAPFLLAAEDYHASKVNDALED